MFTAFRGGIAAGGVAAASSRVASTSRQPAQCGEKDPPHPPPYNFGFKSFWMGNDIGSVRRGFEVYRQVCATCHSLEFVHFRDLVNSVYPEKRVKEIAATYDVVDGPNDDGEMFERPGITTDVFPSPYANEEAARFANAGAKPPDLSQQVAAHHDGVDYLMSLMTSYRDPPYGIELRAGTYYNTYFHGGVCGMPPPLEYDGIEYEDGTPATVAQQAKDITHFLMWASEPQIELRKLPNRKMLLGLLLAWPFLLHYIRFLTVSYKLSKTDFVRASMLRPRG